MPYATVTITGTYYLFDGVTPAKGTIEIIPSARVVVDDAGNTILSGRVKVQLDDAGHFAVALPATDDPDLNPTGFTYTVAARLHHQHLAAVTFDLPAAVLTVDVSDLTEVAPSAPTYTERVNEATVAAGEAEASATAAATSADSAASSESSAAASAAAAQAARTGAESAQSSAEAAATSVQRDVPGGVAPLDEAGLLPEANVPERLTEASLSATYGRPAGSVKLESFVSGPMDLTGGTDYTAAINAAIAELSAAQGGVIEFPAGIIQVAGQIVFPNDGAAPVSAQATITLRGQGATRETNYATAESGTTLNFTGTPTVAHIDTRGMGLLVAEGFTLTTTDTTGKPFIRTTNTVITIRGNHFIGPDAYSGQTCITDAVVMGGTGPNGTFDMTADARFQGYGSSVVDNEFSRIQRGVLMQAAVNSQVVRDNYWHSDCGGAAAIEVHSYGNSSCANYFSGNCIEVVGYQHAVVLHDSHSNRFVGNAYWDYSISNYMTSAIDLRGTAGISTNNTFIDFWQGIPLTKQLTDTAGSNQALLIDGAVSRDKWVFAAGGNGLLIQPATTDGTESSRLLEVKRAGDEATNPAMSLFWIEPRGRVIAEGAGSGFYAQNGPNIVKYSWDGIVKDTGELVLYPGTGASNTVRVGRGAFRTASYATASRPSAASLGAGAHIFDTDLSKPLWSDGAVWRDAVGTAV